MNKGWVFVIICLLIMFWSFEVRFKEIYKNLQELKDILQKSMDKTSLIEKQLQEWKKFLT